MALTKTIIERKIKPGAEGEPYGSCRSTFHSGACRRFYLRRDASVRFDDTTVHVTISQWKRNTGLECRIS